MRESPLFIAFSSAFAIKFIIAVSTHSVMKNFASLVIGKSILSLINLDTLIFVEGDTAESLFKLLDNLDDNDDVQNVYANYDVSEETMASLSD